MAYPASIQSLSKNLRHNLRQPGSLAAIVSVGLHGLLLLPIISFSQTQPDEPEIPQPVALLELSPEEQQRLPDLSTPEFSLPPISETPPDLFSFSPLPNQPPPPDFSSNLPPFFMSPLPAPPTTPMPTMPLPQRQVPITPPPQQRQTPVTPPQPTSPPQPTTPDPEPTDQTLGSGSTTAVPELRDLELSARPRTQTDAEEQTQPETQQPEQQAELQQPETRPTPNAAPEEMMARQQELRELYTYRPEGTTPEEANLAFGEWFYQELGKEQGDLQQVEIALAYPRGACPLGRSAVTIYGVLVNPENNIVEEPRLIQSSGFGVFNRRALEAIEDYEFENETDENQAYRVDVRFEYDREACPAASPVSSRSQTPTS